MARIFSNVAITRKDRLHDLKARENGHFDLEFLKIVPAQHRNRCFDLLDSATAQLRQDLFGLVQSDFKTNGFFLEFGATDGLAHNNTYLMNTAFGWQGILAEPARGWHDELRANRSCIIDTRCVWKSSGETLQFTEAPRGENSAISSFVRPRRKLRGTQYDVMTISLNDLLTEHGAPRHVDFASIDTEGSEYDILSAFDFGRWSFGVICIEHNYAPQRENLYALLTANGYNRVHEDVSRFDDWYVPAG